MFDGAPHPEAPWRIISRVRRSPSISTIRVGSCSVNATAGALRLLVVMKTSWFASREGLWERHQGRGVEQIKPCSSPGISQN